MTACSMMGLFLSLAFIERGLRLLGSITTLTKEKVLKALLFEFWLSAASLKSIDASLV
jgi:hypothetical protein